MREGNNFRLITLAQPQLFPVRKNDPRRSRRDFGTIKVFPALLQIMG